MNIYRREAPAPSFKVCTAADCGLRFTSCALVDHHPVLLCPHNRSNAICDIILRIAAFGSWH